MHEELRGLPGSWDRGIETFRRLRGIKRPNFQAVVGMTLMEKNADHVDATIAAIRQVIPDFKRTELHLNIGHESGHYFANLGRGLVEPPHRDPRGRRASPPRKRQRACTRSSSSKIATRR